MTNAELKKNAERDRDIRVIQSMQRRAGLEITPDAELRSMDGEKFDAQFSTLSKLATNMDRQMQKYGQLKGKTGYKTVPLFAAEPLIKDELPSAQLVDVMAKMPDGSMIAAPHKKMVVINGETFETVSTRYKLVQHADAFKPVVETLSGIDLNIGVSVGWSGDAAWLDCIVEEDVADSVRIGFRVGNAHDGATALTYSFATAKVEKHVETKKWETQVGKIDAGAGGFKPEDFTPKNAGGYRYIELVGYRMACSNGMLIRIPLEEALNATDAPKSGVGSISVKQVMTEIWESHEERLTVRNLAQQSARIAHIGKVGDKIAAQKKIAEFMALLRNPVQRMIQRAQATKITPVEARETLEAYLGVRLATDVLASNTEPLETSWDLYNYITFFATYKAKNEREENKLQRAGGDYLVMLAAPVSQAAD